MFQIPHVMQDHHGRYRCEISSSTERMWSNEIDVVIGMLFSVTIVTVQSKQLCCYDV